VLRSVVQARSLNVLSPFGVRSLVVKILVVLLEHPLKCVTSALFRLENERVGSDTDRANPSSRATAHLEFLQRLPKLSHFIG